ncbi:MAG: L,D-transpeptidase family protein [Pseudonocardiaceae bacterium]
MLQRVREELNQESAHRCALKCKHAGSRSIGASGLLSITSICVLLVAGLTSACAIGADGSETPGALSLAADTGSRAPAVRSAAQISAQGPPSRLAPAAPAASAAPAALRGIPATTSQVVLVTAPNASSTTAMIEAWQRAGNGWRPVLGPVPAHIGADGIGRACESTSRTPAGLFSLTQTFGRAANPGTRQPWFHATANDWWVSDVRSPAYNTHQTCAPGRCPFNEAAGEDLGRAGSVYDYAVVIDYNRWPVHPGAGSAFFLHVTSGRPTTGCVATDRAAVIAILRWLDPRQHPLMSLGVR